MRPAPIIPTSFPLRDQISLSTVDLDELEAFINNGGLLEKRALKQFDRSGELNAHISNLQLNRLQFIGVHLGSNILATSVPLKAAQLVIPVNGRLFNQVDSRNEFVAPMGSAIFHAPDFMAKVRWESNSSAIVIRIPEYFLKSVYRSIANEEMPGEFSLHSYIDLSQGDGQSLANIIQSMMKEFESGNNFSNDPNLIRIWEELLITTLMSPQIPVHKNARKIRSSRPVYYYVKRTTDYVMDHLSETITINELVQESGVALRTLQDGFKKSFGVGPMSYVRQRKLDKVHAELLSSSPSDTNVGDIAAKWGFYHASHFTSQYKKQFSELPSETLSKKDLSVYICRN